MCVCVCAYVCVCVCNPPMYEPLQLSPVLICATTPPSFPTAVSGVGRGMTYTPDVRYVHTCTMFKPHRHFTTVVTDSKITLFRKCYWMIVAKIRVATAKQSKTYIVFKLIEQRKTHDCASQLRTSVAWRYLRYCFKVWFFLSSFSFA